MSEWTSVVAVVAGVAAVVSAIASSLSARNSGRSAAAAEKSADASVRALHRTAVRDLVTLCHETLAEEARIKSFAVDLRSQVTAVFNLAGSFGGSRHNLEKEALEKDLRKADELSSEARQTVANTDKLHAESTIYVNQIAVRVIAARDDLRVTRESMERHLGELSKHAAELRERK